MAMARSLALTPLLLLSFLLSTATAARTTVGSDTVQDACSKSQFPKVCTDGLATKPESKTATPRSLAELFVGIAVEKGSSMGTFLQGKATSITTQDKAMINCYDSCGDDVEEAMAHLNGLLREPTDAKFLELKSWLSSTLGGTSTCEDACKDIPSDKDDVVEISVEFEKLLRVTLDLITQASGSMSADIALPPSDAAAPAAYGAAAPPLGGDAAASSSAEAPAAAAASEGPSSTAAASQGGGASGPSADDSPAAAADAPSAGGSASAPAPSGSSAADAPAAGSYGASAPSGSSGADAPSGGDSDAPAPDDGASGDDGSDDKA